LLELTEQAAPAGLDGVSFASLLTGHGHAPQRSFFWHFPHYTNQGSRPSGAMRDGDWMFVEYYDEDKVELYKLSADVGENRDLAATEPVRVKKMREALAAWRKSINANENQPNPNYDAAKFRNLYIDVDPSKFAPATASEAEWKKMWQWRKEMNAMEEGANKN